MGWRNAAEWRPHEGGGPTYSDRQHSHLNPRHREQKTGGDEELEIHFGNQAVKVQGHGLGKLIDALDEGRLKLMRSCPPDPNAMRPWIKELILAEIGAKTT